MLRQSDASNLIEQLWSGSALVAQAPSGDEDFFEPTGPLSLYYDERRSKGRCHLRSRALMRYDGRLLGVLTCDLSSGGVGILSPVQVFPMEQPQIILTKEFGIRCRVVRCRRLQERCYRLGAEIVDTNSAETFQDLLTAALRGKADSVLSG